MPKQTFGYQERLVDWDCVPQHAQPGATVSHQLTASKSAHFNYFESPRHSYKSSGVGAHQSNSGLMMQSEIMGCPVVNNSCLSIYPINESPLDEEYQRPTNNYSINNRPIPIIHEPSVFLTIPSHTERYPTYPPPPPPVKSNSVQTMGSLHYDHDEKDNMKINFSSSSKSHDNLNIIIEGEHTDMPEKQKVSLYNESTIPYIDQNDESTKELDGSQNLTHTNEQLNLKDINQTSLQNKNIDSNAKSTTNFKPIFKHENSFNENKNIIIHCCCHGHVAKCESHELQEDKKIAEIKVPVDDTIIYEKSKDENMMEENDEMTSIDSANEEQISSETIIPTGKMHLIMPELNLDLSGLHSDVSSDDSVSEKCWKSPDEVRLGCGRVAALAKHFSKLGDAGLIKFKSTKLASSRQFVSEPDMASPRDSDVNNYRKTSFKEFKSETDLLKADKCIATTPEREWSMILLDIQTKNEIEMENYEPYTESNLGKQKRNIIRSTNRNKKNSKLSLAEQQEIIEQLKEFSNLDNVDAPLFIPTERFNNDDDDDDVKNDKVTDVLSENITSSNENTNSSEISIIEVPRKHRATVNMTGKIKLENFRKNSLPIISSTFNVSPDLQAYNKVNKLEKYWSMKDLMSSDESKSNSQNTSDDLSKYYIFPTCSKVVSAPEISKSDDINIYRIQSLNSSRYPSGNVTICSTISISDESDDKQMPLTITEKEEHDNFVSKQDCALSPINFDDHQTDIKSNDLSINLKDKKLKFPDSFIRTKKISLSDDTLNKDKASMRSKNFNKVSKNIVCKSLERIPIMKNTIDPLNNIDRRKIRNQKFHNDCHNIISIKSDSKVMKPIRKKALIMQKLSKSDLDVSERKPTPRFERGDWIFHDFPPLQVDTEFRKLADYVTDVLVVSALCLVHLIQVQLSLL